MGSIKKKLTKTLRKITPKEIAPALPIASMFIPGMQVLSPLLKFALPQLLTAAGSARTSGKISGLNQALAGIGSLAGINASNQALQTAATAPTNVPISRAAAQQALESGTSLPAAATVGGSQAAAAQLAANQQGLSGFLSSGAEALGNAPFIGGGVNTLGQGMTNLSSTLPFGNIAGAPYNPQFGFNMLAPLSAGATAAGIDQTTLSKLEAEAEAAKNAGDIQGYRDASAAVAAAIARFSDPTNRYGNNPGFMANQGGRVGYQNGAMVNDDSLTRQLFSELMEEQTSEMPTEDSFSEDMLDFSRRTADANERARRDYERYLKEALRDPDALNYTGRANGGRIGYANGNIVPTRRPDEVVEIDGNLYPISTSGGRNIALPPEDMGIMSMIGQAIRNLIKGDAMNTRNRDDYAITRRLFQNQGGITRTGYNMGGIGSIPQTPMVPQGMQLDGRGGGFIPMGAQEKRDDVPAMLAKNEFVMTSDAVKAAGGGSVEKGAQKMYDVMNQLEAQV